MSHDADQMPWIHCPKTLTGLPRPWLASPHITVFHAIFTQSAPVNSLDSGLFAVLIGDKTRCVGVTDKDIDKR